MAPPKPTTAFLGALYVGTDRLERPLTEPEKKDLSALLRKHDFVGASLVSLRFAFDSGQASSVATVERLRRPRLERAGARAAGATFEPPRRVATAVQLCGESPLDDRRCSSR